jgi:transcriptional antiterminator NusG
MDTEAFFCLFCETGKETLVETFLKEIGYSVISSVSERNIVKMGHTIKEYRRIIPGDVFFSHVSDDGREPDWSKISEFKYVFYPLKYSDNRKQLRENDMKFVKWLVRHDGAVRVSKAVQVGTKIKIIEGPLKEYEGNIIKVNRRQKCVCVQINTEGLINKIWLSYECIEET